MTVRILTGDVFDRLAELPDESVHCVVTSPPYWGLRDYGVDGAIGLEATFEQHLGTLVDVFAEVRRVLRSDGTLWLNYGDAYANDTKWGGSTGGKHAKGLHGKTNIGRAKRNTGLKPKDLMMMPARVAMALQADGWWLRSEIVWHKPNPMPESVRDRPTSAHEKIFLLAKSTRYFYDAEAVRTSRRSDEDANGFRGRSYVNGAPGPRKTAGNHHVDKQRGHSRRHAGFNGRWDTMAKEQQQSNGANLRNVWTIATHPYPGAHFATFPPALVEPCIKATCPAGGTVIDPFGGAGTVGLVAERLGRDSILIELNPAYADMARRRIHDDAPLFADVTHDQPQG